MLDFQLRDRDGFLNPARSPANLRRVLNTNPRRVVHGDSMAIVNKPVRVQDLMGVGSFIVGNVWNGQYYTQKPVNWTVRVTRVARDQYTVEILERMA